MIKPLLKITQTAGVKKSLLLIVPIVSTIDICVNFASLIILKSVLEKYSHSVLSQINEIPSSTLVKLNLFVTQITLSIGTIISLFIITKLLSHGVKILRSYCNVYVSSKISYHLRQTLISRPLMVYEDFFNKNNNNGYIKLLFFSYPINIVRNINIIFDMVSKVLYTTGYLCAAFYLNYKLTGVLTLFVIVLIPAYTSLKKVFDLFPKKLLSYIKL